MKPTLTIGDAQIFLGSNLDVLPTLPDNSVDAIVTDPPYELGFMGKSWDSSGIAYNVELWRECLRVLKPGGHMLAFSGSRTYHRMTVAIEDAGFEIRDMVSWISNKTFPKSHNISKAIDKMQGADDAKKWEGWGTGLKPTVEPIVLARKPVEGTVAENVLTYGVGGLNIDATRIALDGTENLNAVQRQASNNPIRFGGAKPGDVVQMYKPEGRWPANLVIDETTAKLIDEQSGISKSTSAIMKAGLVEGIGSKNLSAKAKTFTSERGHNDSGGASRFFYVARASKSDRNEGLDISNTHPTVKPTALMQYLIRLITPDNGVVLDPFTGSGSTGKASILEGKRFIGIELTEEYLRIIEGRLKHAHETMNTEDGDLFE